MKLRATFFLLIALLLITLSIPFVVQAEEPKPDINITINGGKNITKGESSYSDTVIAEDGDTIEWQVAIENSGDATATNVILESILPDNTTYQDIQGAGSINLKSSSPPSYAWEIIDISTGATNYYYITTELTDDCGDNKTFTSSVTWDSADSPATTTASLVPAVVDLNITMTPSTSIAKPGDSIIWTIDIENKGNIDTSNLEIVNIFGDGTIDNGFEWYAFTGFSIYTRIGNTIKISELTINAGETRTILMEAQINALGEHTSIVTATEYNQDKTAVVSEDSAKAVVAVFDLDTTMDTATGDVNDPVADTFGEIVEFTINMNFEDNEAYKNIQIINTLPDGLEYIEDSFILPIPGSTKSIDGKTVTVDITDFTGAKTTDITFNARIIDEAALVRGDTLTNLAKMSFDIDYGDSFTATFPNSLSSLQEQDSLILKEPDASLVSRITSPSDGSTVSADQEINHTLRIENSNLANVSPVHGIKVEETVPIGERDFNPLSEGFSITKGGATPLVADTDYQATYDSNTGKLTISFLNVGLGILQKNEYFDIEYKTKVDSSIGAGVTLEHTAQLVEYYSQPPGTTNRKSYTDSSTFSTEYNTEGSNAAFTVEVPLDGNIKPGDVVTYKGSIMIPKGTSVYDVDLIANLPSGLEYVNGSSVGLNNGDLSFRNLIPVVSGEAEAGQTITWANEAADQDITNDTGSDLTLTLTFDALVIDAPSISNGNTKTASFTYNYNSIDNSSESRSDNSPITVDLEVSEPDLSVAMNVTSSGPYEAGKTVNYRLTVENNSNTTAYDVKITDLLPDKLTLKATPTFDSGSAVFNQSGQELSWGADDNLDILSGGKVIINIGAVLDVEIEPDEVISNDVSVSWSSRDGVDAKERNYNKSLASTTDITVDDLTDLSRNVLGTPKLVIGETIDYKLELTLNKGTTDNVVVKETLPEGIEFVSGSIAPDGSGAVQYTLSEQPNSGDQGEVTWNFGTVIVPESESNTINIDYTVKVLNTADNSANDSKTVSAVMRYDNAMGTGKSTLAKEHSFVIKEPKLIVEKSFPTAAYNAGDTVAYTIKVWHPSTTSPNDVSAYDVEIVDTVPAGMSYVSGSISSSGSVDENELKWTFEEIPLTNNSENPLVFTYNVVLNDSVEPAQQFDEDVNVTWSSLGGDAIGERNSTGGINDYSSNDGASLIVGDSTALTKWIVGGNNFTIGEPITFWLKLNINEGTTEKIVIKDSLPAGMVFNSASIVKDNDNIAYAVNNEPKAGDAGELVWDIGTIVNPVNGNDADDIITIKYTASIHDAVENVRGVWLTNTSHLEYIDGEGNDHTTNNATQSVKIIEPELKIEAQITSTYPYDVGDTVTHKITISHTGESNATAYDVKITDILPEGLTYTSYTVAPSIEAKPKKEGNNVIFGDLGNIDLNLGDSYTFNINTVLDTELEPQKLKNYNVKVDYSSIDGEITYERQYMSNSVSSVDISDEEKVSWAKKALEIIYSDGDSADSVIQDITLPVTGGCGTIISWESSNSEYLTVEGVVNRPYPGVEDVKVMLTANISLNETSETKEFEVTIKAQEKKPTNNTKTKETKKERTEENKIEVNLNGEESDEIQETIHMEIKTSSKGNSVTTLTFDSEKFTEIISKQDIAGEKEIEIAVKDSKSDAVTTELNGQMVKNMEVKDIKVKITTERASYMLPAEEINIDEVASKIGKNIELEDIEVNIEISEPEKEEVKVIEDEAKDGNLAIIVKPVSFEVKATHKGKTVTVDKFKSYVKREVAIPEGTDQNKITTAVIEKDGKLIHVPTKVILRNGKYYAQINSLTNSVYTLIWNKKTFDDVENHWSKAEVNDMASRLIINGVDEDRFAPNREITRAEFAAIIMRALGLAEGEGNIEFVDIGQDVWYKGAVKTAYEYRLIKGYEDGTFKPQNKITRQEAMAMIYRAMTIAGSKAEVLDSEIDELLVEYTDNKDIADWAQKAVAHCVRNKLIKGYDSKLVPTAYITRAETAALVRRLLIDVDLIER